MIPLSLLGLTFAILAIVSPVVRVVWLCCAVVACGTPTMLRRWVLTDRPRWP